MKAAQISGIASYLPEKKLGNEELANNFSGWTPEKITRKLGIDFRSIAGEGETALDMGVKAAERLFVAGIAVREEIDFVIFCTQSPDYFLPTSACIIQNRLKIPVNSGAFDINLGCSGYIYSLGVSKGLLESGLAKKILLITSETYSHYINDQDRVSRPIFGDGATATLLTVTPDAPDPNWFLGTFEFGTDGNGANMLIVEGGAHRCPSTPETAREYVDTFGSMRSKDQLFMNGPGIFTFSIHRIPALVEKYRAFCKEKSQNIDNYIFHQANKYMLDRLCDLCEIDPAHFYNNILNRGNTVSSSIPIAVTDALEENFMERDSLSLLVGFGVGLSWGACLVRLPKTFRYVPLPS